MNPIIEAQKRYVEQHGDPLGAQWPDFHDLTGQRQLFGKGQTTASQLGDLADLALHGTR